MTSRGLSLVLLALLAASSAAVAQQYRWTDKDGRIRYSDAPPPAGAKDVRRTNVAPASAKPAASVPFAIQRLQADFPVTLYSASNCVEACVQARAALNRRGIPFTEIVVQDAETSDRLKSVTGATEVPAITVGRQVQRGFEQGELDALLDSAGYPRTGLLPPRAQRAPEASAAELPKPEPVPAAPKLGPYDPSGLQGPAPKPGQYGLPAGTPQ